MGALKNLEVLVNHWDHILVTILQRKLDQYTLKGFFVETQNETPTFECFLKFLDQRAAALEAAAVDGRQGTNKSWLKTSLAATCSSTCKFCSKSCSKLYLCPQFKLASLTERLEFVDKNKLCKLCLNNHVKKCNFQFKCSICKNKHNTLLHDNSFAANTTSNLSIQPSNQASNKVTLVTKHNKGVLLPTITVKLFDKNGTEFYVKALLDSGSQVSFITTDKVRNLQCKLYDDTTIISGVCDRSNQIAQKAEFRIYSTCSDFNITISCCVVQTITCNLPQFDINVDNLNIPSYVKLADEDFYKSKNIDLLLGCDIFFLSLLRDQLPLSPGNLYLHSTRFGYIVAGAMTDSSNSPSGLCGHVTLPLKHNSLISNQCDELEFNDNLNTLIENFWQCEKVPEIYTEGSSEQELAENIFNDTVLLQNNKFEVTLPLKQNINKIKLGDSFSRALQRFLNLEKRFSKDSKLFEHYKKFIEEYIELNHAQFHDISNYDLENDSVYFLPHHPVFNENSKTTKLRVVFDASMKTSLGISLNDLLLNGPLLQSDLFDILILFRLYKYVLISDIQKMFRCINLNEAHCIFQNILWRESPDDKMQCLQLKTVTYGMKSSTYLATRCLVELAHLFKEQYPLASSAILSNVYIDDLNLGSNNLNELIEIKNQLINLLSLGGFKLHKWCSNEPSLLKDIPIEQQGIGEIDMFKNNVTVKTLGITYNVKEDVFYVECQKQNILESYTKRELLSFVSKIFDPLGLVGPILVNAKCLMQQAWLEKTSWDEQLPEQLNNAFKFFAKDLVTMPRVSIKRNVKTDMANCIELIGFSDASNKAYGCCMYIRTIDSNGIVSIDLLCSKSRINPIKKLSTPRLELNSALLLAILAKKIYNSLKSRFNIKVYLYVDSQIVLAWLKTIPVKLSVYISNRVKKISETTEGFVWLYVNTSENPADCLSRGIKPHLLQSNKLWWHGPLFLSNVNYKHVSNINLPTDIPEIKVSSTVCQNKEKFNIFSKYSDINKCQRILAYIYRFISNCKVKSEHRIKYSVFSPKELDFALKIIIRYEQKHLFSDEINSLLLAKPIKSNLKGLNPFIDGMGILRVGGRLQQSELSYDQRHPIILPKRSSVTHAIIEREHKILLHAGQKLILSNLNQKFYIVNGRREVSHVIHKCIICFKLKAKNAQQLMGSLPPERVIPSRAFERVGIDYGGPFSVKMHRVRKPIIIKTYIALFVCFTTKAVHIELATDLTTDSFINCLKRFIARRNKPVEIFCDNASTFKGARNQLNSLYLLQSNKDHQIKVQSNLAERGITFKFIPSYSPVFGGLWEAGIKSVKYHIKRVVGDTVLTYEELNTIVIQIEGVLNSRPLTPLSTSDEEDFSYLTPGHFLTGKSLSSFPEPDLTDVPINKLSFWKKCTKIVQCFWKQWHKQYLVLLQNRPKWHNETANITVGTLVIMRNENVSPLLWPMARVVKVYPGNDGKVRALDIKTSKGSVIRTSVTKVCMLPIESN